MKKASVRHAALAFAVVALVQGCGGNAASGPSETSPLEPSTARGLAAGVLTHLDAAHVGSVSGSDSSGVSVSITMTDPKYSLAVFVTKPIPGLDRCGGDSGYERVTCQENPGYAEVVERRSADSQMPVYIGRTQSDKRGAVMIEVWGDKSPATVDLIQALLADDLIGRETSSARNAAGEALSDFGKVTYGSTIESQ